MLKPRFYVPCPTPLVRDRVAVFSRLCSFLVVLTFLFKPGEIFAQGRLLFPNLGAGRSIQAPQLTRNRPTQQSENNARTTSSRKAETEAASRSNGTSGGVPAQITNEDKAGDSNSVATPDDASIPANSPNSPSTRPSDPQSESENVSSTSDASGAGDERAGCLEQNNGRYAFLRVARRAEDFANVRVAPNAHMVIVPRKNFLGNASQNAKGRENASNDADSATPDAGSESENEVVDDYVAFILTNLDSDEGVLMRDARDGRWDSTDLLSASLIAEGLTTPEKRAHYRAVYGKLLAMLKPRVARVDEPFQKSEIVYNFLHKTALTSQYDLNSSSVSKALDSGVYNCVSATVLFNCFAAASGLDVAALETTGHAKSRVKFADSYLDIETTCSDWNRLPDRVRPYSRKSLEANESIAIAEGGVPSRLDSESIVRGAVDDVAIKNVSSKTTSEAEPVDADAPSARSGEAGSTSFEINLEAPLGYSFTKTKRPMREITDVELVATIYYNVGVDFYQSGAYERAVASYVKALQLAPNNRTILGNLKATLNNWAIDLAVKEKRYPDAVQIALFGLALDPEFEEFKVNLPIFFHDWVEYLAKDNKWEEIKRVQEESRRILATVPE